MEEYARRILKTIWVADDSGFEGLLKDGFDFALRYFVFILALYVSIAFAVEFLLTQDLDESLIAAGVFLFGETIILLGFLPIVTHIIVQAFGSERNLKDTIQVYIYGSTPSFVFGWIPCIGAVAPLVALANIFRGIRKIHKLNFWQTASAVLLPWLLILIGLIAIIIYYLYNYIGLAIGLCLF